MSKDYAGTLDQFNGLHTGEEILRQKAQEIIRENTDLQMHLSVVSSAMDIADLLRQFPTDDEDQKVIQMLGMRVFNAFASSIKLSLSGYNQNSALILRDIMETLFLVDLFRGDPSLIKKWRYADKRTFDKEFTPFHVRRQLDDRDGRGPSRRKDMYKLFSELAAHPNMKSVWMMRPQKDGYALIGPFVEPAPLGAVLFEMGRLAAQAIFHLGNYLPKDKPQALVAYDGCLEIADSWMGRFYSRSRPTSSNPTG